MTDDHYITDRAHAVIVAEKAIAAIEGLTKAWMREDRKACSPRSTGDTPTSGGAPSNPTGNIALNNDDGAVDMRKYQHRDDLGRRLMSIKDAAESAVKRLEPRKAGGPCVCCDVETATHGFNDDGDPVECWACWTFRRKMGYHCGDDIHEGRPRKLLCECPPWCCGGGCADAPAEGRQYSHRCRKRMTPARQAG